MTQLESHLTRTLIATLMLATSLAPAPAAAQGANTPAGLSLGGERIGQVSHWFRIPRSSVIAA